jgi:hypothetical protein
MTNPASQQPAPIPEDLKKEHLEALKGLPDGVNWTDDFVLELIERIARLEAALEVALDAEAILKALVPKPLATPLGTPGREGEKP